MPTSQSQVNANRLNARFSCGPRSESGRKISSLNGLKHGLAAAATIIPTEDASEYDERVALVNSSLRPRSGIESILAANLTRASWMIDRSILAQRARLTSLIKERPQRELAELSNIYKRLFFDRRGPVHGWAAITLWVIARRAATCRTMSTIPTHWSGKSRIQSPAPGLWGCSIASPNYEGAACASGTVAWQTQHNPMCIRLLW